MNDLEAATVFRVLKAGWPDKKLPDETIDLWVDMATDLHVDDAKAAAHQIIREDKWWPTIARFREVTEAHARRRRDRDAETRGIPAGGRPHHRPPDEIIKGAHKLIAERKRLGPHNHHGPEPCPVCGGLPIEWDSPRQQEARP